MNLAAIPAFVSGDIFRVVVEAPRGSNVKLKYEPQWETMTLSRPLPTGVVFPFDWGFVPSTQNADGDPVDAMVLWDVASYPGVVLECRAIGVLQVEQNRVNHDSSERVRNDRIVSIPVEARREHDLKDVSALPVRVRQELEQFALTATALEGKALQIIGWGDGPAALELIRRTTATLQKR
jgi:inorganic pyrophosphatase